MLSKSWFKYILCISLIHSRQMKLTGRGYSISSPSWLISQYKTILLIWEWWRFGCIRIIVWWLKHERFASTFNTLSYGKTPRTPVLVTFRLLWWNILTKAIEGRKGFCWLAVPEGYNRARQGRHGGRQQMHADKNRLDRKWGWARKAQGQKPLTQILKWGSTS